MPFSLCPACRLPSQRAPSGLPCAECRDSVLRAPAICASCLGLACAPGDCARPWIRVEGADGAARFDSVRAAYLALGPGAAVLKSWKRTPNPALERWLLAGVRDAVAGFAAESGLVLVPVPQSAKRRWELGGGSVLRLCEMILAARGPARRTDLLLDTLALAPGRALEPDPGAPASPAAHQAAPQARSRGDERYARRSAIAPRSRPGDDAFAERLREPGRSVVLVDDFLTSGATLRSAAVAARARFAESGLFGGYRARIDVFVLGFRPGILRDDDARGG